MEFGWLEDFLAVLDQGGFSKAAETRNITQSALSRRIRALEDWVGASLFQRTTHSVSLTPAGQSFRITAEETLRGLLSGRAEARELAAGGAELLKFAATNALSLNFFPRWLHRVEAGGAAPFNSQLQANHMETCEKMMIAGQVQFLLCHFHPDERNALETARFRSLHVGHDLLMPVCVPRNPGETEPMFALPGRPGDPLPFLSYRPESGMGRIVTAVLGGFSREFWLRPTFASHVAQLLVTMALEGRGLAWLPTSLIGDSLAAGALVPAGGADWHIPVEVRLYRSRARQSAAAERFWSHVASLGAIDV